MIDFYAPASLFIFHPERAYVIAALFGILLIFSAVRKDIRGMIIAAFPMICWILYGYNEYHVAIQRADIRIDLLFLWPFIVAISVLCLLGYWMHRYFIKRVK